MKIVWSPYALESYENTIIHLVGRWPIGVALRFQVLVRNQIQLISTNHKICPKSITNGLRKCVIHKNVSLVYQIHKTEIEIVAFIDNRMGHNY